MGPHHDRRDQAILKLKRWVANRPIPLGEHDELTVGLELLNSAGRDIEQPSDILLVEQHSEAIAPALLRRDDARGPLHDFGPRLVIANKAAQLSQEPLGRVADIRRRCPGRWLIVSSGVTAIWRRLRARRRG